VALYVGNLERYQGIDLLVEAAAILPARSTIRIEVVGGPMNEVERLRGVVASRGLDDRIRFNGPRPLEQLPDLLAQSDILLSPRTKGNNTPLKLYSYMESGRPILATRLRTHTQVLDDSTALLVEVDAAALARGLLRLAGDEELRRKLGQSAKQRVRGYYSPVSFLSRVHAIYGRSHARSAPDRSRSSSGTQVAVDRRRSLDRRLGGDRRSDARRGPDRRVGQRRVHAYG